MGSQEYEADSVGRLAELSELASRNSSGTVANVLAAAREQLGMNVAQISEFSEDGRQVFRSLEGDAGSRRDTRGRYRRVREPSFAVLRRSPLRHVLLPQPLADPSL